MVDRVADLTWRRPKLVLALVAAFTVAAAVLGRGVEDHLKAAGFTDSASESERATVLLREELGYDANPGIVVLVRDPNGGELETGDPAVRREVARLTGELGDTKFIGRATNPLASLDRSEPASTERAEAGIDELRRDSPLIANDGRSLVISGHLATQDVEDDGGAAAEDAKERLT